MELIEHVDEYWYYARNADNGLQEGMVQKRDLKIVMRLPGEDVVSGFEEGPCAVATHDFMGRTLPFTGHMLPFMGRTLHGTYVTIHKHDRPQGTPIVASSRGPG